MPAGRYRRKLRRCPACGVVRDAVDFKRARSLYSATERHTRCPECGHSGPWWSFPEVEPPGTAEERRD